MERIDKTIEILQAFKEGKRVEYFFNDKWFGATNLNIVLDYLFRDIDSIRIAKEPAYRPYANAEEFLKASKEHGPYVKACDGGYIQIDRVYNDRIHWCHLNESHMLKLTFEEFLKQHIWQDGTPCGILE